MMVTSFSKPVIKNKTVCKEDVHTWYLQGQLNTLMSQWDHYPVLFDKSQIKCL